MVGKMAAPLMGTESLSLKEKSHRGFLIDQACVQRAVTLPGPRNALTGWPRLGQSLVNGAGVGGSGGGLRPCNGVSWPQERKVLALEDGVLGREKPWLPASGYPLSFLNSW